MVAVAIVCAAAMSQAASIAWGFGNAEIRNADGNYFADGTPDATAFLFFGTVTAGDSGWEFSEGAKLVASANMNGNWNWGATDISTTDGMLTYDATAGQPVTLILLDGEVGNTVDAFKAYEGNYIIGDKTALVDASIAGKEPIPYLSAIDSVQYGAGDWTAVPTPEPTSGLLLLLGVAGLALKRKRA